MHSDTPCFNSSTYAPSEDSSSPVTAEEVACEGFAWTPGVTQRSARSTGTREQS